jgi:putative transposase
MVWKENSVMDERLRFVARVLQGETMSSLCREFNISRKTGYKLYNRYKECGIEALCDRTRRPVRYGNRLPFQVEQMIVNLKKDKSSFGAPKIRELLIRKFPDISPPAISTVHCVLDRYGLVTRKSGRRRHKASGTALSVPTYPNDLWCADYKGEFQLGNMSYCYPLTITDSATRFLIACESLTSTKEKYAFTAFERVFKDYGLPLAIKTDNGVPFASPNALFNLSRLSVWWLRLGISIERIKPGNPQQNGRHERMHLTLKKEATRPAGMSHLEQQGKFDDFQEHYNCERPHQALNMKFPSELYSPSLRQYQGLPPVNYPLHDRTVNVTCCGRICIGKKKINLSQVFAGHSVGLRQIEEPIWLVSFMHYDLGFFDMVSSRFEPLPNPFGAKVVQNVLPMCPV